MPQQPSIQVYSLDPFIGNCFCIMSSKPVQHSQCLMWHQYGISSFITCKNVSITVFLKMGALVNINVLIMWYDCVLRYSIALSVNFNVVMSASKLLHGVSLDGEVGSMQLNATPSWICFFRRYYRRNMIFITGLQEFLNRSGIIYKQMAQFLHGTQKNSGNFFG